MIQGLLDRGGGVVHVGPARKVAWMGLWDYCPTELMCASFVDGQAWIRHAEFAFRKQVFTSVALAFDS
jgi:hypothetical protein